MNILDNLLIEIYCVHCNQYALVPKLAAGTTMCEPCFQRITIENALATTRAAHLTSLTELPIEKRFARIEEWMYDEHNA